MPRLSAFPNGVSSFGIPVIGGGAAPVMSGNYWFVDGAAAGNGQGKSLSQAFTTIGRAISAFQPGDAIYVAPGTYNETVAIPRTAATQSKLGGLLIYGLGARGSVLIQPSATNANALTNDLDDVALFNLRCNANGSGIGIKNTGGRFQTYACKAENTGGTGTAMQLTLDSAGGSATQGGGADCQLVDTEFCWAAAGLLLSGNNGLAVTQIKVSGCRFHNLGTTHISESTLNAGPAADAYRNLEVSDCLFDRNEDGTEPTHYLLLNASNSNTGIVTRSSFPTALAGGKNLVSTALLWTSNYHTGGVSTGQPS